MDNPSPILYNNITSSQSTIDIDLDLIEIHEDIYSINNKYIILYLIFRSNRFNLWSWTSIYINTIKYYNRTIDTIKEIVFRSIERDEKQIYIIN